MRALAPALALALALPMSLASSPVSALTLVLDFGPSQDHAGDAMTGFDATPFGFSGLDGAGAKSAVFASVQSQYLSYPTVGADPFSPIPDGRELDIYFEIGAYGVAPSNGDTDWYVFSIGEGADGQSYLGQAYTQSVRGPDFPSFAVGSRVGSVYTDVIAGLSGLASSDAELINLIAGTASHEIGHTLGLIHPDGPEANPGESAWSVMATGVAPSNMPNDQRVLARAFSYDEAATLVSNVGLRAASVPVPAPALLLASGLVALVLRARRQAA